VSAAPALAAGPLTTQFCQTSSGNFCIDDWNGGGSGNAVRMEEGGVSNEDFVAQPVGRCGGTVTSSCPFADTTFDSRYEGFSIVQLLDLSKNLCMGTNSSANAVLGACNSTSSGTGGADGTVFVDHDGYLISLYWSDQDQHGTSASCVSGSASDDGAVNLNFDTASGCPEWNYGLDEASNFDWARWILHDGSWPLSSNNITVLTQWMSSEEPAGGWWDRDNPLNNGYDCGGGSGLGSCPNLFAAAQYVVDNLQGSTADYGAIDNDLAASDSPATTAQAICDSPWAGSHYDNCTAFNHGSVGSYNAPASAW
jgi:hypothetical protein